MKSVEIKNNIRLTAGSRSAAAKRSVALTQNRKPGRRMSDAVNVNWSDLMERPTGRNCMSIGRLSESPLPASFVLLVKDLMSRTGYEVFQPKRIHY